MNAASPFGRERIEPTIGSRHDFRPSALRIPQSLIPAGSAADLVELGTQGFRRLTWPIGLKDCRADGHAGGSGFQGVVDGVQS